MRFGSVCSGIEAASVAWHPLGWQAAWLAEIEPFPSAVLKHHYPDVPNYGDMTQLPDRIRSGEVEAPDLFCGGTPCQAFSVAGKRQSLADARGNLSLTFCDIADAIDESRSVRGLPATIVFWENVPGVLSTGDNAFGCFLAQLCGGDEPLHAPDGWPDAGCVSGPTRTAAWRILDAQYFGLAQRRKRVFVVASAREKFDPAAVLFEFDGVRRDTAPSREAGQTTPTGPAAGLDVSCTGALTAGFGKLGAPEIDAYTAIPVHNTVQTLRTRRPGEGGMSEDHEHLVPTLSPALNTCSGSHHAPDTRAYVVQPVTPMGAPEVDGGMYLPVKTYSTPAIGHIVPDEIASTITKNSGSGGETQNPAFVVQPVTYDFFNITAPVNGQNRKPGDPCHTLARSNAEHAVVMQPVAFHPTQTPISSENVCHTIGANENATAAVLAPTLTASNDPSRSPQSSEITAQVAAVFEATALAIHENQRAEITLNETTGALSSGGGKPGQGYPAVAIRTAQTGSNGWGINMEGTAYTLDSAQQAVAFSRNDDGRDATNDLAPTMRVAGRAGGMLGIATAMQVRRLTPTECERLQGFPDGYTAIPWRGKSASECPDGPRYKALGNSWAVPVVRWIGKRIQGQV